MKTRRLLTASALAVCAFQIPAHLDAAPFQYTVTDLGLAGQVRGYATGINASGQVVGYVSPDTRVRVIQNNYQSIVWTLASPSVLNGLGGTDNVAYAINDSGQVTGYDRIAGDTGSTFHAVRVTGGIVQDLGTLGGTFSNGNAINASGQIAGSSYTAGDNATHAVRWTGTVATDLGTLGGVNSYGRGINASGQVAGYSSLFGSSYTHAVRWIGTTAADLGTLGGLYSYGYGINASGQVVGASAITDNSATHATLWTGTTALDLGTLGELHSVAYDINFLGDILGAATSGFTVYRPFLYTSGTMYDLMSLLAPGSGVTDIQIDENGGNSLNDSRQIAATGVFAGERHIIRLTPVAVPEPTASLLTLGAGTMWVFRRKRAAV